MKRKRIAVLIISMLLASLVLSPSAYAVTTSIGGDVHTDATWTYYSTVRYTGASGQIRLDLTNCTANTLQLYLRNAAGTRISQTQYWPDSSGGYVAYVRATGGTTFPAGQSFKFTGRLTKPIWDWEDNTWAGYLAYN
ncbi:MAG: hypothetical protein ABFC80_02700 [Coriobacteriales bacterium]|nr:hypothetical protein [Actinomycetes bacterium]